MKILCIAHERSVADTAARALGAVAPDVAVTWVHTPSAGVSWIQANRDAAALILAADPQDRRAASIVDHFRSLGLETPIVMIAPAQATAPRAALGAGADGVVLAGPSFEAELPRIVSAAIDRAHARRDVLVRKLRDLDALRVEALRRLAQAEEAHQKAEQRSASELADATERLAALQAQHTATLVREAKISAALQERLFELESALQDAKRHRAAEAAANADHLLKRHTDFTASLAQAAEARDTLSRKLNAATVALDEAQKARADEAAAAAAQLARREAELGAALEEAAAARAGLERALSDARAAASEAERQAREDLAAAAERHAALEERIAQEEDSRTAVERDLAAAHAGRHEAEQRHAAELAASAMRLAEVQSRYDAAVTESAQLALREADVVERLARESAARATLEQDLADSHTARTSVERELADLRVEHARVRRRFLHVVSAHRRRAQVARRQLEAQLARERADAQDQLQARDEELRRLQMERETLQHALGATQEQVQLLHTAMDEERQRHDDGRAASEAEVQRLSAESERLRDSLEQVRSAFQDLEQIAGQHALERGRLESLVAERDAELSAQAERHLATEQAAQAVFTERQETMQRALDASSSEIAQLRERTRLLAAELETARIRGDAWRSEAERVPALRADLEQSGRARRRQFERAPYGLCECTREGVITRVNHSMVKLLGYRRADELTGVDFAATAFECPDDLRWLIDRAVSTGKTEIAESTWKRPDGPPSVVRLQALATANGSLEIVVEDITNLRVLEQRVQRAQRMEAVGRLASEVAVTCETLLRDAANDGDRWLAEIGGDAAQRVHAEQLLAEVRRAGSFLRQLAIFGYEQTKALEPVSVDRVLRELEPVLEQLVGEDIKLVFPKTSGSFEVDVDAERVERVFVNIAHYARERMPRGGRVSVELANTVVGARFIARYPNVRPGPHVLVTVAELGAPAGSPRRAALTGRDGAAMRRSYGDHPGVDVGALVELIADCGGHLWMEAERSGNLMLKIHLPKRAPDQDSQPQPPTQRSPARRLTKWFRGKSEHVA